MKAKAKSTAVTFSNFAVIILLIGPMLCGCSGDNYASHIASVSETNMQKLCNIYSLHVARKGGQGPKSADELRKFLEEEASIEKNIALMGIARDDFEKISLNEKSEEPFVVRYGLFLPPMSPKAPIVLDASPGDEGLYRVIMSNGEILEVEKDTYDDMASGKWRPTKAESEIPNYKELGKE